MLNVGDKLDNYEILDLLGSGGFGRVWRAKDLTVKGREVAIKELADPTEERLEGFLREMEILASLKHPGIVTFHHVLNNGQYLVMEYIPEGSLRRHLHVGIKMGAEKAIAILSSLCDVLVAVHEKHVVHRDLILAGVFFLQRIKNTILVIISLWYSLDVIASFCPRKPHHRRTEHPAFFYSMT